MAGSRGKAGGINRETEDQGALQIGPTDAGFVRIYVYGNGIDLPMDFEPEEAEEIAQELLAAAERARQKNNVKMAKPGKGDERRAAAKRRSAPRN